MEFDLIIKLEEAVRERRTGKGPRIYLVDEKTVGKRCWGDIAAHNDFHIGNFLFERGVQVPEMYQLIKVEGIDNFLEDNGLSNWFILMQRINGATVNELSAEQKEYVLHQYRREITKVLSFGIFPFDSYQGYESCLPQNSLFDISVQKLYLVDFEFWHPGTASEMEECRNNLDKFYQECVWK